MACDQSRGPLVVVAGGSCTTAERERQAGGAGVVFWLSWFYCIPSHHPAFNGGLVLKKQTRQQADESPDGASHVLNQ